jgi:hypothetical protein
MLADIEYNLLEYYDRDQIRGLIPSPYTVIDLINLLIADLVGICPDRGYYLTFKGYVVLAKKRHDDALKCGGCAE